MLRRITLFLFFALFLIGSFNTANAAFPVEKNSSAAVSSTPAAQTADEAFSQNLSKKELKKESRKISKGLTAGGGKSKVVAALLAIFLGSLGIHSFYMGMTKKGFLQLGLTILGLVLFIVGIAGYASGTGESFPALALVGYLIIIGVSIWALVDFIRILTGSLEPEEGFED